ncbi:MAG: CinA family protein [Alphaproteobacteria bacterium]
MVVTAESCTGGLIAAALTEIPGSSSVVGRGFITYANDAKAELLGVPLDAIREHGAVSEPVARAMAEGALARAPADISVGVTGIAGPTGGSSDRPVGTVQLAASRKGRETVCRREHFDGDRTAVRLATVEAALDMMLGHIE